jgi:hypothetical protein
MSEAGSETPIQEAISIITIGAILLGVPCCAAAVNKARIISAGLFWVAGQAYAFLPALNGLKSPLMAMLVAAATVGAVIWIIGLARASPLATWLSAGYMAGLERQTAKLKRNRARIQKRRRERDGFEID